MTTKKAQSDINPKESSEKVPTPTDRSVETFPPDGDALAVIEGIVDAVLEVIADCLR